MNTFRVIESRDGHWNSWKSREKIGFHIFIGGNGVSITGSDTFQFKPPENHTKDIAGITKIMQESRQIWKTRRKSRMTHSSCSWLETYFENVSRIKSVVCIVQFLLLLLSYGSASAVLLLITHTVCTCVHFCCISLFVL